MPRSDLARRAAYALPPLALLLTVPWGPPGATVLGLPAWAALSLAITGIYAVAVAWALGNRFAAPADEPWETSEPSGRADEPRSHGSDT